MKLVLLLYLTSTQMTFAIVNYISLVSLDLNYTSKHTLIGLTLGMTSLGHDPHCWL